MNNDYKGGSWSERFSWIITVIALVLVAILSIGLLCALFIRPNDDKEQTEQTASAVVVDGEGNAMMEGVVYPMPEKMSFSAAAFAVPLAGERVPETTVTSEQSVDVRIQAYVRPDDAVNKEVDFSVAWGNAPTHGSEDVSDYLTVTPDSDGSTMATVSCKKAFGDDTIVITVTTREGGYTATCTVTFTGIASGIEITSSTAAKKSTSARGTYYELGTGKTYTFDIGLTNAFGDVTGDLSVTGIGGSGSLYFGEMRIEGGAFTRFTNMQKKDISSLADKFITSATVSGGKLVVTTSKTLITNYYSSHEADTLTGVDYYYDRYVYQDDGSGLVSGVQTSDNYEAKAAENIAALESCYFTVTVKDNISGLTETVRLWVVSSVSSVSLSPTELEF
mgnify:CR=1 FL=1